AAHATGQSLGATSGHLVVGEFTPAVGTSALGAPSLASLQHDTAFHAELQADVGLAYSAGDVAALSHTDGATSSVTTAHLEAGSLHSGIEDATLHSAFSTQMHL